MQFKVDSYQIGSSYASEVVPMTLRGYLTAYTNMCFAAGQLIGGGVLDALVSRTDQWGYRIPFAVSLAAHELEVAQRADRVTAAMAVAGTFVHNR